MVPDYSVLPQCLARLRQGLPAQPVPQALQVDQQRWHPWLGLPKLPDAGTTDSIYLSSVHPDSLATALSVVGSRTPGPQSVATSSPWYWGFLVRLALVLLSPSALKTPRGSDLGV